VNRQQCLKLGATYAPRKPFSAVPSGAFSVGREYILERAQYSPYDSCVVFSFREVSGSGEVQWWWSDQDPDDEWQTRFEELSA
jgi:hypothetical protein